MYCLDTDIIVSVLRGEKELRKRIEATDPHDIAFTAITLCELFKGAYKAKDSSAALSLVRDIMGSYRIFSLNEKSAEIFGKDFSKLEKEGRKTQDFDLLIASVAKAHDLVLVTRNKKDFQNIPELKLEEW